MTEPSDTGDADDELAPPPMVIVGVPPPEQPVGRVIGELSPSEAQRNSVSISCGINFSARRSASNEMVRGLVQQSPPRRRRESDLELLAGPAHSSVSDGPHARVEVGVEVGDQLVTATTSPLGIRIIGRCSCED